MDAAAVSYPGFEADLASLLAPAPDPHCRLTTARLYAARDGDRDRRPRRGRQVHRRPGASPSELGFTYLDSGAMYRCVALAALRARRSTSTTARRSGALAEGLEIELRRARGSCSAARDVSAAIREPEVTAAASRVSVHPQVREAMVAAPARS